MNPLRWLRSTALAIIFILSCHNFHAQAQTCAQLPSGIVGWWPGDGNSYDIISGNNGTAMNGVTFDAGKVGQAFRFAKNSTPGVVVPSSTSLNLGDFTIEAWVNVQNDGTSAGDYGTIVSKLNLTNFTNGTTRSSYAVEIAHGGPLQASFVSAVGSYDTTGGGTVPLNIWTHIAVTRQGINLAFYVNGALAGTSTQAEPPTSNSDPLTIGALSPLGYPLSFNPYFGGLIDELSIYNRALSAAEVQQIFAAGTAGKCKSGIPPAPVSVVPSSGTGSSTQMTFTFTDPRGAADLGVQNILINNGLDARHACYLAYVNSSSTLLLVDDNGDAGGPFAGSVTLGNPAAISNSQCSVSLVSAVSSGSTLTLTLNFTFTAPFAGAKVVYMASRDQLENNSGWQALGVWQVPGAQNGPIVVTGMSPARGQASAGAAQTYTFTWTDSKSVSDLGILNVLVNNGLDGAHACYLAYIATGNANQLILVDDAGDAGGPFAGTMTVGSAQTIQNSQCLVNGSSSSAVLNGTSVTLNLNIAFKSNLLGNRIFFLAGRDSHDANNTGWQVMGTSDIQ
jgi:hypothetical protein